MGVRDPLPGSKKAGPALWLFPHFNDPLGIFPQFQKELIPEISGQNTETERSCSPKAEIQADGPPIKRRIDDDKKKICLTSTRVYRPPDAKEAPHDPIQTFHQLKNQTTTCRCVFSRGIPWLCLFPFQQRFEGKIPLFYRGTGRRTE